MPIDLQAGKRLAFVATMAALLAVVACAPRERAPEILFPDLKNAAEQYRFAVEFRYKQTQRPTRNIEDQTWPIIVGFQKVVERFPDDKTYTPLAVLDIGDAYYRMGEFEEALKRYERAYRDYVEIDFVQAKSILMRGSCSQALGRHAEANKLYRECFELYGGHPDELIQELVRRAERLYRQVKEG